MSTTTAAAPPHVAAVKGPKWIWLGVAIAVGVILAMIPTPTGLTHPAQLVLAITAFTVVLWASEFMNNGVASILMMGLLIIAGIRVPLVLSGFSDGAFWTLLAVLFLGFAMRKTGLAERLSYYILSLFPGSYSGILTAFFVIGFVLAQGIPSMTVRTAIMAPIAWALCQSLGLPARSTGAALIVITVVEMAVTPGISVLLGSLNGPVVIKMFGTKNLPIDFTSYARIMTVPNLIQCAFILLVNPLVLRPEKPLNASKAFAKDKLKALGPLKRHEAITGAVVIGSIFMWVTAGKLHTIPTFVIGMIAMAIFAVSGILQDADVATGVSWTLLLFVGGIFGLANVIPEYKITDWLAGYFVPIAQQLIWSPVLLLLVVAIAMLIFRFLDPTAFIAIPVLFLPLVDALSKAGIPPMVLTAPLVLGSAPFWVPYMNFWIAMGDGLTGRQAFSRGQLFRLANVYGLSVLVAVAVGYLYWKAIGGL
jgi:DASS family divalent anion:Na+ symporter